MVTVVLCELGIAQQGSTNNGYLHLSLAHIPPHPVFFPFSNFSLLVQQGSGRNTQQTTVQEVFIHSPGKEESMPEVHGQTS